MCRGQATEEYRVQGCGEKSEKPDPEQKGNLKQWWIQETILCICQ
jgi:hypothetical protein